jgi:hypothetical protein
LLRIFLVDGDDYPQAGVEKILFENFKVGPIERKSYNDYNPFDPRWLAESAKLLKAKVYQDMFMAIPPVISNMTTAGKNIALRLIETRRFDCVV